MADWHTLHLTFDPPATPAQLSSLRRLLTAIDYDAPVDRIDAGGTTDARHNLSGTCRTGEVYTLWRSPLFEIQDNLARLLADAGLSGHGWLKHAWGEEDRLEPASDRERFAFGHGQGAMEIRIAWDTERARLSALFYGWRTALLSAADRGDDTAMLSCAASLRGARRELGAHEATKPTTTKEPDHA